MSSYIQGLETSDVRFQSQSVDLGLTSRSLMYFLPIVMILGRWYITGFYLILVFSLLVFEKLSFDNLELKISNSLYWVLNFVWGMSIVIKSPKIWNGLIYFVSVHPFYDGIAYYIGLYIIPFIILVIFRNINIDEDFLEKLFLSFNISSIILSIYSIFALINSGFNILLRINGLWPDLNIIAGYFMIIFLFNLSFLVNKGRGKYFVFNLITVVFSAMGLFLTQTRAAWLAVVITVVIFFIKRPKIIIPSLIIIFLFFVLFFDAIQVRYLTFKNFSTDVSTLGRFQAWYTTYLMLQENLYTGYGFDAFLYYKDSFYSGFLLFLPHSHNTFLRLMLETGLIGMLLYITLLIKAIYYSLTIKSKTRNTYLKKYTDGLQLSFISLLVVFMFEPYFSLYSNAAIIIWIFISLSISIKERYG